MELTELAAATKSRTEESGDHPMTVGIVTDSSCDLSDNDIADLGVEIVPLFIRFGDEELTDREQITVKEFYRKMADSEHLPQTAAPAPGHFEEAFRRHLDAGCDKVVCINISSAISATMQAASQAAAANGLKGLVEVVDSRSVTAGLGTLVLEAARLAADGAGVEKIVNSVNDASYRTRVFGTLNTLENLKRGGRIGGAQAMLGSILSIKPLIDISSGEVAEAGRQRTRTKALRWLCNKVKESEPVENLAIMHGEAEDLDVFQTMLTETVSYDDVRVVEIGPVVGAHAGAGVMGVAYQAHA